jgi:hypothetical protein
MHVCIIIIGDLIDGFSSSISLLLLLFINFFMQMVCVISFFLFFCFLSFTQNDIDRSATLGSRNGFERLCQYVLFEWMCFFAGCDGPKLTAWFSGQGGRPVARGSLRCSWSSRWVFFSFKKTNKLSFIMKYSPAQNYPLMIIISNVFVLILFSMLARLLCDDIRITWKYKINY